MNIALLETDESLRKALVRALTDAGHKVKVVIVDEYNQSYSFGVWPDVFITNNGPVGWGLRLAQAALNMGTVKQAILITGGAAPTASELGEVRCLLKPFDLAQLLRLIEPPEKAEEKL